MEHSNGKMAIVPNDFSPVTEAGNITSASARDLQSKHLNKLKSDAMVFKVQRDLELAKRKLEASKEYKKYKEIQKELKLVKRDAESANDIYMGAVSNGLAGFMEGESLAKKLIYISEETQRKEDERRYSELAEEVKWWE